MAALQLLTDFKKAGDSVRRDVLYNILSRHILVIFNKMCFNEPYSQVRQVNIFLMLFLFRMVCNKRTLHHHYLSALL